MPINNFKAQRASLSLPVKTHLDALIISVSHLVPHLQELEVTNHVIEFTFQQNTVKFIFKAPKLYIMFK